VRETIRGLLLWTSPDDDSAHVTAAAKQATRAAATGRQVRSAQCARGRGSVWERMSIYVTKIRMAKQRVEWRLVAVRVLHVSG
jgi:hypothetical protein